MTRTRVLLADDHAATMERWRTLLEPEFEIAGAVGAGRALVDEVDRTAPDVIVTDIVLSGMNGLAAAAEILRRHPSARVVFATVDADRAMLRKALALGAFGYVLKVRAADDLAPAIRAAMRGQLHISTFPVLNGVADTA